MLVLVDGLRREITGMDPDTGQVLLRHVFTFPDMGLLRDAVFTNGRLYASADDALYVYPGPAGDTGSEACANVRAPSAPLLYGVDVLALTRGFQFPILGGTFPPWTRVYPGASRIYRLGIHHGVDIYRFNGPPGFGQGTPVLAMGDGQVLKASIGYQEMTDEEFLAMLDEAERVGQTPPEILDRLEGKRVIVDHGSGITTVYAHLDEIAPGVVPGAHVEAGQVIGTVGVTGTQAEGKPGAEAPHLHFEIWVGDRYLGYGLSLRETMWWFAHIFPDVEGQ
jgi:murein DD-endopeptidase MepM/ murein hydrolase activator NlpD